MKQLALIILSLFVGSLAAQELPEKAVKTEVTQVSVFIDGAQLVRRKAVSVPAGKTRLKFEMLSPFIDAQSVQVKAEGALTVLNVNHQQNYLNKAEKSKETSRLQEAIEALNQKINLEQTYLAILSEELAFLLENRDLSGKNEAVSLLTLQQTADFFGKRYTALKLKEIEHNRTISELSRQRNDLQKQLNTLTNKKEFPSGEIYVTVDAPAAVNAVFELTYLVGNAGWYPSYDIRAKNIDEPVQLAYKAHVKQDTKTDWNNVSLKLSSANPNVSGVAPKLKPYFLNYNTRPPSYKITSNTVSGRVLDNNHEPLPGATVMVQGTTIGAVTDIDGNYRITIPQHAEYLVYSFIGFETQTLPIQGSSMHVVLQPSQMQLDEVVVMGYGVEERALSRQLQGKAPGISLSGKRAVSSSLSLPTAQTENQTTVDFEVKVPYTIKSDNKNYTVDLESYQLPAAFQYFSIPKIDKDAFLIAYLVDWEKYNLLEGEANVFFEDTYVGKTLLDVRYASDTLELSLGRDKQVSLQREKVKDLSTRQFIGNKKEESRAWKISVRNNKSQSVKMTVLDQVPVSTNQEIEVQLQTISGGKLDTETGEVKWEFELEPGEQKVFDLKYVVKFPKQKNLIVE
ncbi:MAG: mucoidy inhibitor MuiA family protein [Salinivirgaceae bacterium]